MDSRQSALSNWVAEQLDLSSCVLEVVSGDASFRRYFRAFDGDQYWIAMDAPPEKEDSHSFLAIALAWHAQGIQVPLIKAHDLAKGFLLLSDMGDDLLLSQLDAERPDQDAGDRYYSKAIQSLVDIQATSAVPDYPLPPYDRALLDREMALFPDWLIRKKLSIELSDEETLLLENTFSALAEEALAQPQVPVHRDYHSRNLMVLADDSLGIIDFQDAVIGPITYDLVSLLRDCYIVWPDEAVDRWVRSFFERQHIEVDFPTFKRWFDWMGMQRHLKASGIFARLSLRDGKHGYLNDIPRTVDYLVRVSERYAELSDFHAWLVKVVVPQISSLEACA